MKSRKTYGCQVQTIVKANMNFITNIAQEVSGYNAN